MSKIFINYRSSDTAPMAEFLYEKLVAHFGKELVFRDDAAIPPGIDFREFLWAQLALAEVMLVLVGRHWLEAGPDGKPKLFAPDDFVRDEITEALRRNIRVVPILIGGQQRLAAADLPEEIKALAYRQYRHLRDRSSSRDIDALILDLEKMIRFVRPEPSAAGSMASQRTTIFERDVDIDHGVITTGDNSPGKVNNYGDPR
jgi:hypothetical protein